MIAAGVLALVTALPAGTYRYAVYVDGKVTGTSSITIARDAAALTVKELVDLRGDAAPTTRTLDPATFSTRAWAQTSDEGTAAVTVSESGATYRDTGQEIPLAAPVAGPSTVFDFFVAEFVAMPAMLHATGASSFAEYCLCEKGFEAKTVSVVPVTETRPERVPAEDEAIAIRGVNENATLWYDPETFLLRELDFSKDRVSYVRI